MYLTSQKQGVVFFIRIQGIHRFDIVLQSIIYVSNLQDDVVNMLNKGYYIKSTLLGVENNFVTISTEVTWSSIYAFIEIEPIFSGTEHFDVK